MTGYNDDVRNPYYLWIAWRYFIARGRQSLLTTLGVTLGVTIVAIMQSYIGGFLNFFTSRAIQSSPAVLVTQTAAGLPDPAAPTARALRSLNNPLIEVRQLPVPSREEALDNPRVTEETIRTLPGVAATAPFLSGQGIIVNGDLRQAVNYVGIHPLEEARVTDFTARLTAGTPEALAEHANGIILGAILAEDLAAVIGDRVTVISQTGVSRRFLVVGTYSAELREVDQTRAYVNLRQAQQLRGTRGITGLGVRTATLEQANAVARRIEGRTGQTARTWREVNAGILDLFTMISMIIYLIVGLTMLVAGFGIANTLILTVSEKQRDIGVLKALGVPPSRIALVFVTLGVMVGILGVLFGLLLGAAGIEGMSNLRLPTGANRIGLVDVQTFPMLQVPRVYILSGLFGLLVSVGSSVLPSLRASKADPLQIIRGAE